MNILTLIGQIDSKHESFKDPALTYPYDAKGPRRLQTSLNVKLSGYSKVDGPKAEGGKAEGSIYFTIDGTEIAAELRAGQTVKIEVVDSGDSLVAAIAAMSENPDPRVGIPGLTAQQ